MTPKLYFNNPYDAIFMNVNHGVRLLTRTADEYMEEYGIPEDQRFYDYLITCEVDGMGCEAGQIGEALEWIQEVSPDKIWVHPDDEKIFEPRKGDLVKICLTSNAGMPEGSSGIATNIEVLESDWETYLERAWGTAFDLEDFEIIQRNGKPFIAPQQNKGDIC